MAAKFASGENYTGRAEIVLEEDCSSFMALIEFSLTNFSVRRSKPKAAACKARANDGSPAKARNQQ
jgi:hypothetical protein